MACRGVHFALTEEQASRLRDPPGIDGDGLLAFVEEIEEGRNGEGWDEEWVQESDKSRDAIHRCLTDGRLEWTCVETDRRYVGGQWAEPVLRVDSLADGAKLARA